MKKTDYDNERKILMNTCQKLINDGKIDESKEKMEEVKALDKKWDDQLNAEYNYKLMNDELDNPYNNMSQEGREAVSKMYTGTTIDLRSGVVTPSARNSNPQFLSNNRSMTTVALERGADTSLLNSDHALGDTVRGLVTGKWSSPELKNMVTTSTTGALIPEVLAAQVIDLARAESLFASAEVPTVPMTTNNMTISRIAGDPVFQFKPEGEEGTEVGIDIDSVKLESKTVYGWAYVTLEAIESSENLDSVLRDVFSKAIAQAIDRGMLYGAKDSEGNAAVYAPEGVMNSEDILTLDATNNGYDDFVRAVAAIRQKNYVPTVWGINAYTDQTLALLRDNEGRYLGEPDALTGLQKIVSNQLDYDEESGSDGLVFAPEGMLIGIQNDVRIKLIDDETALKSGLVGFQVYSMLDCKVVTPAAICRIKGLK